MFIDRDDDSGDDDMMDQSHELWLTILMNFYPHFFSLRSHLMGSSVHVRGWVCEQVNARVVASVRVRTVYYNLQHLKLYHVCVRFIWSVKPYNNIHIHITWPRFHLLFDFRNKRTNYSWSMCVCFPMILKIDKVHCMKIKMGDLKLKVGWMIENVLVYVFTFLSRAHSIDFFFGVFFFFTSLVRVCALFLPSWLVLMSQKH